MKDGEITFGRGDILRKVLDRTGIAWHGSVTNRPAYLRRGGIAQAQGADLLRKFRGFSQNARLLSSLDDLIEFKYPAAVLESSWRKWNKPSRLTLGKMLRRYGGETPQGGKLDKLGNVTPLSRPLPTMAFRFSIKPPKTPVHATRYPSTILESVWRRIKKPTRVSDVLKDTPASNMPKTMNKETEKAINVTKRKMTVIQRKADKKHKDWEQLSSRLNNLIEFAKYVPYRHSIMKGPMTEAQIKARKAIIDKLGNQKPETFESLKQWPPLTRRKRRLTPMGLSANLDDMIQFADPRPRNPLGEFSPQNAGGPDPNAMATVYKMPQQQPQQQQHGLGGEAATLLTGGALGAVGAKAGQTGWEAARRAIKHLAKRRKSLI